jgi:hypothetical protein
MATLICVKPFPRQPGNFAALEAVNACRETARPAWPPNDRAGRRNLPAGNFRCRPD